MTNSKTKIMEKKMYIGVGIIGLLVCLFGIALGLDGLTFLNVHSKTLEIEPIWMFYYYSQIALSFGGIVFFLKKF